VTRDLSPVASDGVAAPLPCGLAALLQVLLVVVLGGVEPPRRQDLGDDGVLPLFLLLRQRLPRQPLLLRRVVVDPRPVMRPDVVALTGSDERTGRPKQSVHCANTVRRGDVAIVLLRCANLVWRPSPSQQNVGGKQQVYDGDALIKKKNGQISWHRSAADFLLTFYDALST